MPQAASPRSSGSNHSWWSRPGALLLTVGLVVAGTVYLLALGTKGNEIAQVLSLTVAVATLLVTLYEKVRHPHEVRRPFSVRRRRSWAAALIVAVSVCVGTVAVWRLTGRNNLNVTVDMASVAPAGTFGPGAELTLLVPGAPPQRRRLALTVAVENTGETGNCAGPAMLTLQPTIDGVAGAVVRARSGKEAVLSLRGATRHVDVRIGVERDDPECSYRLDVQQAILFN